MAKKLGGLEDDNLNDKIINFRVLRLKNQSNQIKTFKSPKIANPEEYDPTFLCVRKRPGKELILLDEKEDFEVFKFKYLLGFFAGCNSFVFRVNFKEYKMGLKPAKFSLLLNQFHVNLDRFISIVNEILVNNFPLNFYENFLKDDLNEIDFKIHFLVFLRSRNKYNVTSKFYIIPRGCFVSHLREQLWTTLFTDPLFIYSLSTYYKGLKSYLGVVFLLILYYIYKLLHHRLQDC